MSVPSPNSSERSIAQLHAIIRIAFGWSDSHLHHFRIHGRDYGISRPGGPWSSQDAGQVRLADFQSRRNERFLYEYDICQFSQSAVADNLIIIPVSRHGLPRRAGRLLPGDHGAGAGRPHADLRRDEHARRPPGQHLQPAGDGRPRA
ncbi:MAG: IS1096 element passenger TnpR family protein, partial [Planctomycetaceae bacterium]